MGCTHTSSVGHCRKPPSVLPSAVRCAFGWGSFREYLPRLSVHRPFSTIPLAPVSAAMPSVVVVAVAVAVVAAVASCATAALPINFAAWNQTLQAHVAPGVIDGIPLHVVDYGGLRVDPGLASFLASVRAVTLPSRCRTNPPRSVTTLTPAPCCVLEGS